MAFRSPSTILVYCGKGSNKRSRQFLMHSLEAVVDLSQHSVKPVTPEQIKEGSWTKMCCLIAFGGGYDLGFESALGREGANQIFKFVHDGGSYLGICAGAYWACDYIEFDKGGDLEVTGERFLKFYPGLCIGPALPGFQYTSRAGVHAVPIKYKGKKEFHAYFEGGGFFKPYTLSVQDVSSKNQLCDMHMTKSVDSCSELPTSPYLVHDSNSDNTAHNTSFPVVDTLGTYRCLEGHPTAIVRCRPGHGVVILSGVHLEFSAYLLDKQDIHLRQCLPQLLCSETDRLFVFKDLLDQLGVKCKEQAKL